MYVNYSIDKKNKLILVTGSYGLSLGNKTREVTTLIRLMYVNYSIDKRNKLIHVTGSYGLSLGNKTREVTTLSTVNFS